MNVAYSDRGPVAYDDPAPLILAASSPQAGRRARRMLDQSGARIGAELPIDQALERLDRQVAASAVWVEVDEDAGGALDDLLHQIARDVGDGRYAAVVSTSRDIVDQVVFGLGDSAIEILVDADEIERAAALAIATSHAARGQRLSDVAADGSAEQLRQLTAEVNRIAGMLSRLSDGPAAAPRAPEKSDAGDKPEVSVETVRKIIRARRLRSRYFPDHLFADPAWDMLLDLLQAELSHLRVPVSSLCIAASVPATTALRWLKTMVTEGLFVRRADPHDGRRVFVELAPDTRSALRRYFAEVDQVATI